MAIFGQFVSHNRCAYSDAKNLMRGIEVNSVIHRHPHKINDARDWPETQKSI